MAVDAVGYLIFLIKMESRDNLLSRAQSALREASFSRERQQEVTGQQKQQQHKSHQNPQKHQSHQALRPKQFSGFPDFIEEIIIEGEMLNAREKPSNRKSATKTGSASQSKREHKTKKKSRRRKQSVASSDSDYDTDLEDAKITGSIMLKFGVKLKKS